MLARNKITYNEVRGLFDYSKGNLYWKVKPSHRVVIGAKAGALRPSGYTSVLIKRKAYMLHRLIYLYHHGYLPDVIDHIDRDKSNNCIENLREATHLLNALNRSISKRNTTGTIGVQKYRSGWRVHFRNKYHGDYKDFNEAVMKRQELEGGVLL